MKNWLIVLGLLLHSLAVFGLPTGLSSSSESALLLARAKGNDKQKVADAADAFASDVATVSSSLNAMGQTTDRKETQQLARKAFVAEKDEDQHRAVLNAAANGDAKAANKKIVDNTPIVLDGLQSIMSNPSMANTMKSLNKIETARNANILPSITQLSNSAFQNTGVDQEAQKFQATTGTKMLKQLAAKNN